MFKKLIEKVKRVENNTDRLVMLDKMLAQRTFISASEKRLILVT